MRGKEIAKVKSKKYAEMSLNELRKYVLKNKKDKTAWKDFVSRPHLMLRS